MRASSVSTSTMRHVSGKALFRPLNVNTRDRARARPPIQCIYSCILNSAKKSFAVAPNSFLQQIIDSSILFVLFTIRTIIITFTMFIAHSKITSRHRRCMPVNREVTESVSVYNNCSRQCGEAVAFCYWLLAATIYIYIPMLLVRAGANCWCYVPLYIHHRHRVQTIRFPCYLFGDFLCFFFTRKRGAFESEGDMGRLLFMATRSLFFASCITYLSGFILIIFRHFGSVRV